MSPEARRERISAQDESQSLSLDALAIIFAFVVGHVEKLGIQLAYDASKLSRMFGKPGTPLGLLS
jgi:hypothetical protein